MLKKTILFGVLLCTMNLTIFAQTAKERSVEVSVTTTTAPPQLNFSWPADENAEKYIVYKKELAAQDWGIPIDTLAGDATTYIDQNPVVGEAYEYAFFKEEFDLARQTICVTPGTPLQFVISDMYDIGLCCSFGFGYYNVEACGTVQAHGNSFGTEAIHDFVACDNGNACTDINVTISPDMFPNSTSWVLKNSQTGEELGSSGAVGTHIIARPKYGFIYAGIEVPAIESRGTMLLLIDDAYLTPLGQEIDRLELDLIRDGWQVKREAVNQNDPVADVKAVIQTVYAATPDLKSLFILGHVPVPYSGYIVPDTHKENHEGAWAADTYYGELTGVWTDELIDITTPDALPLRNHNIPGDGKLDQDSIPTKMELQVGRVDLSRLNFFELDEFELTRRYLDKNHAFKTGQLSVQRRALVDDNFMHQFAAPAASGWRNFAPMFGAENTEELDYFTTMKNESYLWSYGCGGGSHISAGGIGNTQDFASDSLLTVFTMLFGSQFGDWDNSNNFLRAPLAQGLTLTNCWAGSPAYTFHHMAMGYNIGYSIIRTQNTSNGLYNTGPQLVHTALMGDPSLRMHPVKMPQDVTAIANQATETIEVSWTAPTDEMVAGYYIYRSNSINGVFERIHQEAITTTSYIDPDPLQGENIYMVKTLKLETSGSGTYYNLSLGVDTETSIVLNTTDLTSSFKLYPNPSNGELYLEFEAAYVEEMQLSLMSLSGKILKEENIFAKQGRNLLDLNGVADGVYLLRVRMGEKTGLKKVIIMNSNQ
ncbi:MAG: T9SS type A sorting domain-containing protein [Saprospiraceae bacterium]